MVPLKLPALEIFIHWKLSCTDVFQKVHDAKQTTFIQTTSMSSHVIYMYNKTCGYMLLGPFCRCLKLFKDENYAFFISLLRNLRLIPWSNSTQALGQTADWFKRALSVERVRGNLQLSGYSACGQDGGVQLPRQYVEGTGIA